MSYIEIPTDTIRGSIEFFCQDLGAKLLEQSDHFAHIELFDQEILFHFDPTYRKERRAGFYTLDVPSLEIFDKIHTTCEQSGKIEIVKPMRELSGSVKKKSFSIRAVSGHEIAFMLYLGMEIDMSSLNANE